MKNFAEAWAGWAPGIHATLLFVTRGGEVLLIDKKTGIGAGKVNGPGGKIEPGETPEEAICREADEELSIRPTGVRKMAEVSFRMSDMPDIHCHVFVGETFEGEPRESREATPRWTAIEDIPWERMWEDDRHWLPQVLAGEVICARFIFEGETLLASDVKSGSESWIGTAPFDS